MSLVTKENKIQQARVIFNPLTDIFTKCFLFCFIVINLPLQDLKFVRKELKIIMEDPQNLCSRNGSLFGETTCWFSGGLHKFRIISGIMAERCQPLCPLWASAIPPVSVIWPPNVELSFCQVHCSCQNLSCIAAVSEELILWQSTSALFLSAAV